MLLGVITTTGASAASFEQPYLKASHDTACVTRLIPTAPTIALPMTGVPMSKSSAVLGGRPSALDQIKLAQDDASKSGFASSSALESESAAGALPQPAAGGLRLRADECSSAFVSPVAKPRGGEDFLASKRLRVSRTGFDSDWSRVSAERISQGHYQELLGAAGDDSHVLMTKVNRWVNRAIEFTEDGQLFGKADYWAGAGKTLALRRGDCEDIALTKMELLAAAGVRREDMILTIAKDLVRNADHAILIVRHDGRYFLLDNNADEVLDASDSHDYRPIFSYGADQTWIHGY
ncbi:MAG: transglutaminase-like cysteine peptidase [Croceibacterium sp.]